MGNFQILVTSRVRYPRLRYLRLMFLNFLSFSCRLLLLFIRSSTWGTFGFLHLRWATWWPSRSRLRILGLNEFFSIKIPLTWHWVCKTQVGTHCRCCMEKSFDISICLLLETIFRMLTLCASDLRCYGFHLFHLFHKSFCKCRWPLSQNHVALVVSWNTYLGSGGYKHANVSRNCLSQFVAQMLEVWISSQ